LFWLQLQQNANRISNKPASLIFSIFFASI